MGSRSCTPNQLITVGVVESLRVAGKGKARGGRAGAASTTDVAMRAAAEEDERQATVNQGFSSPYAPFRHRNDQDNDDPDDSGGLVGQDGHAYEVTVRYLA